MRNSDSTKNFTNESVTLNEWMLYHHNEEEIRSVFLNMDRALKYIHEHGYCIEVFYPTEIEILNNEIDHIQFRKLVQLSSNISNKKEMIKEDVFNSTLIQIGLYSNSLKYLTPEFLRENFDSFIQFIPQGDVPYYRGVVQRGASVYFCEYALEKRNRDLAELEKQLEGDNGNSSGKQLYKSSNQNIGVSSITNDKINDSIYRQINGLRDSAFINILILPTISLLMILLFGIIAWVFSMI
jgi:hypothetical protein